MTAANYLQLLSQTPTQFWCDSGEPADIQTALNNGACGVTTNPILIPRTVLAHAEEWRLVIRRMAQADVQDIAHAVTAEVVSRAADMVLPIYERMGGQAGYTCAQGNPNNHASAQAMVDEAIAFDALRPNIACKIAVSAAGIAAIEELASRGITTTCTTSHTVPQALAIAEAFRRGLKRRTGAAARRTVHCFAVLMAGRLDDHLRQEVEAGRGAAGEAAITIAGLAVTKRAYQLFQQRGYEAIVLIGGMRGNYHVTELAGGRMVLTIAPAMQADLIAKNPPLRHTIDDAVPADLLQEIERVPDFRRAYEPDGLALADFAGYGTFVKTQGQFIENYARLQAFIDECLA